MTKTLAQVLDDDLDPTDADLCAKVAHRSLKLMLVCQRVLFAHNAGMRIGRDDAGELGVRMLELGSALGLCSVGDSESVSDFRAALDRDAGVESRPRGEE